MTKIFTGLREVSLLGNPQLAICMLLSIFIWHFFAIRIPKIMLTCCGYHMFGISPYILPRVDFDSTSTMVKGNKRLPNISNSQPSLTFSNQIQYKDNDNYNYLLFNNC